ncbi:hypothetical protein BT69DRAFT_1214694 [Atractiella rhizophila]|nr:hypothetical protein BT69DRAFT_1214694 [Atractiella rhizophila]
MPSESAIHAEALRTPMSPGGRSYVSSSTATGRGGREREPSLVAHSVSAHEDEGEGDDGPHSDGGARGEEHDEEEAYDGDVEDDGDVEYTLKDRQDAINIEHPFGLRIWKPALYKKSRSVTRNAETALHVVPSATEQSSFHLGNILWTLLFGWWLALAFVILSGLLWLVPFGGEKYGRVVFELAGYLFWPFGKYVEGFDDALPKNRRAEGEGEWDDIPEEGEEEDEEDEGERDVEYDGRTYGRRAGSELRRSTGSGTGTLRPAAEGQSLLQTAAGGNGAGYGSFPENGKRLPSSSGSEETIMGKGNVVDTDSSSTHTRSGFRVRALGRLMYWTIFYIFIAPLMILVCGICWALVFSIPMAKLMWELVCLLAVEPLALHFRSPPKFYSHREAKEPTSVGSSGVEGSKFLPALTPGQRAPRHSRKTYAASRAAGRLHGPNSTVLLCTYRAVGLQYYKYTIDGVNIMFILLLPLVFFVIFDDWFIREYLLEHPKHAKGFLAILTSQATIFILALLSVIPLSYFIGMAVASISAQSSIGMGAVINATFGSLIEILLYAIALIDGKAALVEGSIVGSLLAGVLLMPGFSMIGGAFRRKEQKFNAKSAGVTSTMLIMAIIGTLTPTLFYEIYGTFQLVCEGCPPGANGQWQCKRCHYEHLEPADDPFYQNTVRKLSYYCAILLVLSYLTGLWFSLKTHASQIWQNVQAPAEHVPPSNIPTANSNRMSIYKRVVAQNPATDFLKNILVANNNPGENRNSQGTSGHRASIAPQSQRTSGGQVSVPITIPEESIPEGMTSAQMSQALEVVASTIIQHPELAQHRRDPSISRPPQAISVHAEEHDEGGHGGHDAPNWSRTKSASVLMGCTVLYAIIAEILVDCVDVVLEDAAIPEKFLGITLFALVPNTTEFMNAISFALHGNIALSMEIGSAYALQVCLLQIPAMLAFSAFYWAGKDLPVMARNVFTLVFPRWDMIAIIFSVFLFTYVMVEARANYYRGTILVLSYLVLMGGFFWAPANASELSYLVQSRVQSFLNVF